MRGKPLITSYLEGIGLLCGMILGAGIFALPYAMAQAGIFWGIAHFLAALFLILVIHFLYGEVAYLTEGKHRFTGYVYMYLGKWAERSAFFLVLFGYYGTLLAYIILGGLFLNNIFNGAGAFNPFWLSLAFFVVVSAFSILRFESIGMVNFYLTIPLLIFVLYLVGASFKFMEAANFAVDFSFGDYWFLPYGVWIFALGGYSVLPEVRDIMAGTSLRDFKRVILISVLIAAVFSLIFALGVLGVTGNNTTEDALSGLKVFLGREGIIIGSIIGFLAVFTSYLAMSADLKEIFKTDYGINIFVAWVLAISPPFLLFIAGATELVVILSLVGAVGLGVSGMFILEMSDRIRKSEATMSHIKKPFKWLVGAGIILGAVYEVWSILVK